MLAVVADLRWEAEWGICDMRFGWMPSRKNGREGYIGSDGRCPLKLVVAARF